MNDRAILSGFNAPQCEAVESGRGAFLVVSGPGSGKTHVIVRRIAHLVNSGIPAWKIVAITFTNKAAEELRKRLSDLLSPEDTKAVWAKTFHATCLAMLRRDAEGFESFRKKGLRQDFTVWGERESWAALRLVVKEIPDGDLVDLPSVKRTISLNKSLGFGVDGYRAYMMENGTLDKTDALNIEIWGKYQELAYRSNALDFGDLELWGARLLREEPERLAYWRNRLTWLLVDEYQDTSPIQYRLIRSLAGKNGNIMVVGDPDQSIYAFRGANIGNILSFEKDFPGAKVIRLEQNYRSTKNVLRVADALIKHNEERREKDLWTENAEGSAVELHDFSDQETEARFVVNEIIRREDLENKRTVAILFRVNAQSRPFEEVLVRERLPYILLGGLRFYERMEVQDVLGYVRQMANPNDVVSFRRILNVPKRGLGKVTEDRIVEEAQRRGSTPLQALEALLQGGSLGKRAEGAGKAFLRLLEGMTKKTLTLPPGDIVRMILTDTGYAEHLQSLKTDEAEDRLENLFELERVASGFSTIKDFLEHVALYEGAGPADMKDPHVVVSTCHRAKGTEFDTVFVVGLAEGLLPHSRSMGRIEEERRLCYVAMTRAKDTLILTRPKSMWSWDGASRKNLNPSRFLKEAGLE